MHCTNTEAFNLEHHRESLFLTGQAQLRGRLMSKIDVEGIVQETFLEACLERTRWRSTCPAVEHAWLHRAFHNNLVDEIRRFRRQSRDVAREQEIEGATEGSGCISQIPSNNELAPEAVLRQERAEYLMQALQRLPGDQRRAVELHHLQGLTLAEGSEETETDQGIYCRTDLSRFATVTHRLTATTRKRRMNDRPVTSLTGATMHVFHYMTATMLCMAAIGYTTVVAGQDRTDSPQPEQAAVSPITLPKAEIDEERLDSLTQAIDDTVSEGMRAELMVERAKEYMRANEWKKAATEYQAAAEVQPQNSMHWMRAAILLGLAKDRMHYDQLANKMLQHFKETGSPYNAERTAKMCWLPVPPVDERELAEKLADLAVERRARAWGEYYPSTRALGHYRYGEYDKALEALAESDRMNDRLPEPRTDLQAINRILKAMCLLQLGHRKDGTETLRNATEFLQKNVANPELLYTAKWNDWLLATILQREARQLLQTDDDAESAPAPSTGAAREP